MRISQWRPKLLLTAGYLGVVALFYVLWFVFIIAMAGGMYY